MDWNVLNEMFEQETKNVFLDYMWFNEWTTHNILTYFIACG
jgi:hypothetical protein